MKTARRERIKLFAGYLNTIAAGMIVTGIVAPGAALILNPSLSTTLLLYFAVGAFLSSLLLHAFAQAVLGVLPDDVS